MIYVYYIQYALSIFWLAILWAHWKTPAHGSEVLRVKDSVWTVMGRHTWRNCVHGQMSGQPRKDLLAPWKYFMIRCHGGQGYSRWGLEVWVVGPSSAVSTHKKLRWQNKILFTGTALERLNLGRCPWNPWFTLSVWPCLGKTFTYKTQDREIVLSCLVLSSIFFKTNILKYLTHSLNVQMESLHIEPVWGCGQSYHKLCCCPQSPGIHRRTIAGLGEGFCGGPCAVTRLQCWGSMLIPSGERTPVDAGVVIEGTLFDIICVYVPPVLSNSNFHDYFQLDLKWI